MAKKKTPPKTIPIECQGAAEILYSDLTPAQGDLKTLDDASYLKFKKLILEEGFSEPISIWKHKKKNLVLNGHQRLATVKRMVLEDGYAPPKLPVSFVEARDLNQAKRKILAMTSQFGRFDDDGLYEFMSEGKIPLEYLKTDFELPGFKTDKFIANYSPEVAIHGIPQVDAGEIPEAQTAHVKTVQMFFDVSTAEEFGSMVDALKKRLGLDSLVEVVLHSVNSAHKRVTQ